MRSIIGKILTEAAAPKKTAAPTPVSATASPPTKAAAPVAKKTAPATTTTRAAQVAQRVQVASSGLDTRTRQLEQVMDNMLLKHGTGLMLAGATGIGKTTFVKQMGKLLGLPVILVEAPHITEEHLINIPFIVFEPVSKTGHAQSVNVNAQNFHVQLGQSHLAAELAHKKPVPDATLISMMRGADANLRQLWHNMGGDEKTIPPEVAEARSEYRVILFLDEYFRQTSANVRNILRGILNGRIGNDRIPAGTYVIYASNLTDVGQTIEEIPLNADFKKMEYQPPTKAEFMHYLTSKFEKDTGVPLKPEVIQAFDEVLKDEHISYDDANTEIRTSPRRWEQIMLYVNASVPVKDSKDAAALMANVKAQFQQGEAVSSLHKITEEAVRKIITATGGESYADAKALAPKSWRDILQHQIETKIKLGDTRTYIPVIAGLPGIGKTAQAADVAQKMNMLMIHIDCSTLSVDEITGIPVPKQDGHKMAVQFSEPALYQKIMNEIEEDTAAYMADPSISSEKKKAFENAPYKYIIFFDELNRVKSANVFNSLRRVVLEKSFNDQTHLPAESIVIAAMNPYDKGTVELTGHLKDATDYIDTAPDWDAAVQYWENVVLPSAKLKRFSQQSKEIALDVVKAFVNTYTYKKGTKTDGVDEDHRRFTIKVGDEKLYVSPREYTTMLQELVAGVDRVVRKAAGMESDEYQQALYKAVWTRMKSTLSWIMDKHQIDSPQFMGDGKDEDLGGVPGEIQRWLKAYSAKFLIKTRAAATLEEMLDKVLMDPTQHLMNEAGFVNYMNSFDLNKFAEDFENYLAKLVDGEQRAIDVLLANTHNKKVVQDGKLRLTKDMISKLEYVINELRTAAQVHNLSADLEDRMEQSVSTLVGGLAGKLSEQELTATLDKIHEIFS
jgi:MoxR-like ATPase